MDWRGCLQHGVFTLGQSITNISNAMSTCATISVEPFAGEDSVWHHISLSVLKSSNLHFGNLSTLGLQAWGTPRFEIPVF